MPAGRPTDYRPEYAEQAFRHCLLGATDADLALLFKVSERTINRWRAEHEEFCRSVDEGREDADAHVAKALYHKAKGGDTRAAEIWLRNRQSHRWRDKQVIEHEGGKTPIHVITGVEKGVGSEVDGSKPDQG